jgi:hypothetical protein
MYVYHYVGNDPAAYTVSQLKVLVAVTPAGSRLQLTAHLCLVARLYSIACFRHSQLYNDWLSQKHHPSSFF